MKPRHLAVIALTLLMILNFAFVSASPNDFLLPPPKSKELLPANYKFPNKSYNLAEQLNLNFQIALGSKKANTQFFDSFGNQHLPPISLSRNWYLPIQNWGSVGKFYEMEIAHAKESRSSLLLGFFQKVEKRSKIGLGLHYTDLSDEVTNLEHNSRGLFINYIVEY